MNILQPSDQKSTNPNVDAKINDDIKAGKFRIQIASDLHLEHLSDPKMMMELIKPTAPYLALLGDIGTLSTNESIKVYSDFLFHVADQFKHVFILAGNHEYYNGLMTEVDAKIHQICQSKSNLHYLNRSSYVLDHVRIVGVTLWSNVPEHAAETVSSTLNDYKTIRVNTTDGKSRLLNVSDTNGLHSADVAYLKSELKVSTDAKQPCIVLTHHAPLKYGVSEPIYEQTPERLINYAFCTPLDYFFNTSKFPEYASLKMWGFGHTHYCVKRRVGKTHVTLIANQRGYDDNQNYNPACVFEL